MRSGHCRAGGMVVVGGGIEYPGFARPASLSKAFRRKTMAPYVSGVCASPGALLARQHVIRPSRPTRSVIPGACRNPHTDSSELSTGLW